MEALLDYQWWLTRLGTSIVLAFLIGLFIYRVIIPWVVWKLYRKNLPLHELVEPDAGHGAGSADIFYMSMTYDCRKGDVVIEGRAPRAPYWQVGVYDKYMRALDYGHLNDRTVETDPAGNFTLRLTRNYTGEFGSLNCARSPQGMLIYRVVLPEEAVPHPVVRLA